MTETEKKQRWTALASSGGVCAVCGRPLIDGEPQGAHRIAKTFPNYTKWGTWVINHPLNIVMVCSLACNQSCNIGNNPGKCIELISRMVKSEERKYREGR